ncbi:hypothetical protein SeLEV6574_g05289 [Synchytrium endobioticum]|uniref:protein-tyrosine-phosphatase n=1 Tax=Synchytrium endobioticum TaxID=286115 RepID=A0A507CV12_9FUNG|nr:hypothetical protein SeLEV6574_g05289 [Synchytrium endobioticum]
MPPATQDDIDLVETNLYLSSWAPTRNKSLLQKHGITHIVSVLDDDNDPPFPNDFTYHLIRIHDTPTANILAHFASAHAFIADAHARAGRVLVHCCAGISRAPTIVLAHLMQTHDTDPTSALHIVQRARPVAPNEGFMAQLRLWRECQYTLDARAARRFAMELAARRMRDLGAAARADVLLAPDPALLPAAPRTVVRCRKCRRVLVTRDDIVAHVRGPGPVSFTKGMKNDTDLVRVHSTVPQCSLVFVEAMEWIRGVRDGGIEGVVVCPGQKCGAKLGSWNWAGNSCSCGAWVVPSFGLHLSKVDILNAAV